ncbi:hypothetical protein G7048_27280 (plasmid) [Diaphorobacter sp. HDW4B]|uniref:hypothetical protein n=1 Tax=Diaphorobacter sp. HDW4B TaxID=2714925 RepID=UPI00140C2008|nr:hypothetical protein [Diaphorobacter sp. HDW4B]QIL74181.1 hypothetical protein G7048_27280 [Diaphorobacter sp. HDW4B]
MPIPKGGSMRSWIVGLMFAASATGAAAQQTMSFTSPPDTFKLNSTATGTVAKSGPFLTVRLDQHVMWQPKKYAELVDVIGYKIELAGNENGRWNTSRSSALVPFSYQSGPGLTKQVPTVTALIPVDGVKTFDDKWLILTIVLKHRDGEAYTHSHSERLKLNVAH